MVTKEVEINIKEYIEKTFTRTKHFDALIELLNEEFASYKIYFCREGGVTLVPMIAIGDDNETHRFTLMSDAFNFAIGRYKEAVIQETIDAMTNGLTKALE